MNERKYYTTPYWNKAITISFLLNEDFMAFEDKRDRTKKIYSFKNSDRLKTILEEINKIKNN